MSSQELVWVDVRPTAGSPLWPALKMQLVGQKENKGSEQQVPIFLVGKNTYSMVPRTSVIPWNVGLQAKCHQAPDPELQAVLSTISNKITSSGASPLLPPPPQVASSRGVTVRPNSAQVMPPTSCRPGLGNQQLGPRCVPIGQEPAMSLSPGGMQQGQVQGHNRLVTGSQGLYSLQPPPVPPLQMTGYGVPSMVQSGKQPPACAVTDSCGLGGLTGSSGTCICPECREPVEGGCAACSQCKQRYHPACMLMDSLPTAGWMCPTCELVGSPRARSRLFSPASNTPGLGLYGLFTRKADSGVPGPSPAPVKALNFSGGTGAPEISAPTAPNSSQMLAPRSLAAAASTLAAAAAMSQGHLNIAPLRAGPGGLPMLGLPMGGPFPFSIQGHLSPRRMAPGVSAPGLGALAGPGFGAGVDDSLPAGTPRGQPVQLNAMGELVSPTWSTLCKLDWDALAGSQPPVLVSPEEAKALGTSTTHMDHEVEGMVENAPAAPLCAVTAPGTVNPSAHAKITADKHQAAKMGVAPAITDAAGQTHTSSAPPAPPTRTATTATSGPSAARSASAPSAAAAPAKLQASVDSAGEKRGRAAAHQMSFRALKAPKPPAGPKATEAPKPAALTKGKQAATAKQSASAKGSKNTPRNTPAVPTPAPPVAAAAAEPVPKVAAANSAPAPTEMVAAPVSAPPQPSPADQQSPPAATASADQPQMMDQGSHTPDALPKPPTEAPPSSGHPGVPQVRGRRGMAVAVTAPKDSCVEAPDEVVPLARSVALPALPGPAPDVTAVPATASLATGTAAAEAEREEQAALALGQLSRSPPGAKAASKGDERSPSPTKDAQDTADPKAVGAADDAAVVEAPAPVAELAPRALKRARLAATEHAASLTQSDGVAQKDATAAAKTAKTGAASVSDKCSAELAATARSGTPADTSDSCPVFLHTAASAVNKCAHCGTTKTASWRKGWTFELPRKAALEAMGLKEEEEPQIVAKPTRNRKGKRGRKATAQVKKAVADRSDDGATETKKKEDEEEGEDAAAAAAVSAMVQRMFAVYKPTTAVTAGCMEQLPKAAEGEGPATGTDSHPAPTPASTHAAASASDVVATMVAAAVAAVVAAAGGQESGPAMVPPGAEAVNVSVPEQVKKDGAGSTRQKRRVTNEQEEEELITVHANLCNACGLRYSKNPSAFDLEAARTNLPADEAQALTSRMAGSLAGSPPAAVGRVTKHAGRKVMDERWYNQLAKAREKIAMKRAGSGRAVVIHDDGTDGAGVECGGDGGGAGAGAGAGGAAAPQAQPTASLAAATATAAGDATAGTNVAVSLDVPPAPTAPSVDPHPAAATATTSVGAVATSGAGGAAGGSKVAGSKRARRAQRGLQQEGSAQAAPRLMAEEQPTKSRGTKSAKLCKAEEGMEEGGTATEATEDNDNESEDPTFSVGKLGRAMSSAFEQPAASHGRKKQCAAVGGSTSSRPSVSKGVSKAGAGEKEEKGKKGDKEGKEKKGGSSTSAVGQGNKGITAAPAHSSPQAQNEDGDELSSEEVNLLVDASSNNRGKGKGKGKRLAPASSHDESEDVRPSKSARGGRSRGAGRGRGRGPSSTRIPGPLPGLPPKSSLPVGRASSLPAVLPTSGAAALTLLHGSIGHPGSSVPGRLSSSVSEPVGDNLLSPNTGGAAGTGPGGFHTAASLGASHGATTMMAGLQHAGPCSLGGVGQGSAGATGTRGGGSGGAVGLQVQDAQIKMMAMLEQHMAANPTDPEIPGLLKLMLQNQQAMIMAAQQSGCQ